MKRIGLLTLIVTLMFVFTACGETEKELTNVAEYDDCVLTIGDLERTSDDSICVHATFTNNSEEAAYALSCFSVKAFQSDTELENVSDINDNEVALTKKVKNGESVEVSYVFSLTEGEDSPVEVLVCTPTSDEEVIAKKTE